MDKKILHQLVEWKVCSEGFEYAEQQASVKSAWTNCQRGDWMLWYAEHCDVDKKLLMLTAIQCARLVQHLMKDQRSIDVIDVAERYCNGRATKREWEEAVSRAASAYDDANANANANANAADAAADAAAYAAYAAAYDAYFAADAATAAATAAAYAADARNAMHQQCADIVRDTIALELINHR